MKKEVLFINLKGGYREKYENMAKYLNDEIDKLNNEIKKYKETVGEIESTNKSLLFDCN